MNHRLPSKDARFAANPRAYALGRPQRNGFHIRKIVWGRLMARAEKRDGEHIRRVIVLVEPMAMPSASPRVRREKGRAFRSATLQPSQSANAGLEQPDDRGEG